MKNELMKELHTGQFFGNTDQTIQQDGLILTNTEYTHSYVDWHYHENAYFTFILAGNVLEGNKREKYHCSPGTLLFHHCQESHYNIKPKGYTRGLHIELEAEWLEALEYKSTHIEGSTQVMNPAVKILFHQIFLESKRDDDSTSLALHNIVTSSLGLLFPESNPEISAHIPPWVNQVRELLQDAYASKHTLTELATILGIHPVHLSRYFPKYFNCTMGEYIRQIRVARALSDLGDTSKSLTEIAMRCGFSDQSHFIRCFKELNHITPSQFRRTVTS